MFCIDDDDDGRDEKNHSEQYEFFEISNIFRLHKISLNSQRG
jgi:hypothetical protein